MTFEAGGSQGGADRGRLCCELHDHDSSYYRVQADWQGRADEFAELYTHPPTHFLAPHFTAPTPPPPAMILQADRQGRADEFAATFAKSDLRSMADAEIDQQLHQASDLGGCWAAGLCLVCH